MDDGENPLQKEYDKLTTLKDKYIFLTAKVEFRKSVLFFKIYKLDEKCYKLKPVVHICPAGGLYKHKSHKAI